MDPLPFLLFVIKSHTLKMPGCQPLRLSGGRLLGPAKSTDSTKDVAALNQRLSFSDNLLKSGEIPVPYCYCYSSSVVDYSATSYPDLQKYL